VCCHPPTQTQPHREVTALLQRKSGWVPADVARFTELYAAEHANEQAVAAAKARYSALGDEVDTLQLRLVDLIRERYQQVRARVCLRRLSAECACRTPCPARPPATQHTHTPPPTRTHTRQQEQLWSDKIRRASTWWTWGLMGLHFASFMAVYTFIEPRKRAALTAAVAGMLQQHTASLDDKLAHLAAPGSAAAAVAGRSGAQQQQQQQSPDAGPQLQQQVLAELQKVQHQLQALQQQLPQHAQAAAAGAGAAVKAEAQAAASLRQWRVPGRAWASRQLAAAGSLAHQSWIVTKDKAQDVAAHFRVLQELAAHGKQPEDERSSVVPPVATAALSDSSRQDQQQPRTPQKQQQQDRAAPQPGSSSLVGAGLWQQLRASSSVVHITKAQLAAVGAAASAAGAGVAAVVLIALSGGSRGGGAS
jgi:hypothetical protein